MNPLVGLKFLFIDLHFRMTIEDDLSALNSRPAQFRTLGQPSSEQLCAEKVESGQHSIIGGKLRDPDLH